MLGTQFIRLEAISIHAKITPATRNCPFSGIRSWCKYHTPTLEYHPISLTCSGTTESRLATYQWAISCWGCDLILAWMIGQPWPVVPVVTSKDGGGGSRTVAWSSGCSGTSSPALFLAEGACCQPKLMNQYSHPAHTHTGVYCCNV